MASTNAGKKVFISPVAKNTPTTLTEFNAISDWIEIAGVGNHGESGTTTNMLTYDTWGDGVTQKGKGMSDAGTPELEIARIPGNAGQTALRNAAKTNLNYLFKIEGNDPQTAGGTPTKQYNRGLVAGPRRPNGRNEDFDLEVYTLGFQQPEILVEPT